MRRWGTEDMDLAEAHGLRTIGVGLRRARLAQGMSQRQLGWRVGLHQSTISRLETGTLQTLRMRTLARIMGTVAMSSGHLFPDEPRPTRLLPGQPRIPEVAD